MEQTKTANQRSTVLALYPNHRAVGYALMDINSPTHIRSSNYRYITPRNEELYVEYVENLLRRFEPDLIVLESEKSRKQNRGERMQKLFYRIEDVLIREGYSVEYYSRKGITEAFGVTDKSEIADIIVKNFPTYAKRRPQTRDKHDGSESPAWCEFDALSLLLTHVIHLD